MKSFSNKLILRLLAAAIVAGALPACAPLVVGGAVVGGMVATDRRSSGAQLDDESIELRGANRIRDAMGSRVRVNLTSYNRQVLLTGETPNEQDRQRVEQVVAGMDNVRAVVNELVIMDSPNLQQRSADALVTGKVKASMVDSKDVFANAFKVVTERGTVYLMGRVTQREADRATEVTRGVSGVRRVVRILEIISEDELQRLQLQPDAAAAPAPAAPPRQ
ncbi:BON domain-containing protein [Ramlibacter sp. 2FC]|uniref:BON domain-containing protein n=1 Tax=Ramlibacter sp. 2FC TaxID=2502188 RepID=UPI0010FA3B49|nr:BON domain-containing protein [Ramlibacter sp. 2FC]